MTESRGHARRAGSLGFCSGGSGPSLQPPNRQRDGRTSQPRGTGKGRRKGGADVLLRDAWLDLEPVAVRCCRNQRCGAEVLLLRVGCGDRAVCIPQCSEPVYP